MPKNNNDFDSDELIKKQTELDKILNDMSKLSEKIIDVLDNDVKTQESIGKIIEKYDKKQCRIFLKNWGNKICFGLWTLIVIVATSMINKLIK